MSASPAWQDDDGGIASELSKIEQQFDRVLEILDGPAFCDVRDETISGWSCGEHAGHVAMVAQWIAAGIEGNLADPLRDADGTWSEHTGAVLEMGDFPRGVATAPSQVDPAGRPREDFLPVLATARLAWVAIREQVPQLADCRARFPHFALGFMTSTEWVRFCAIHTDHHLAIVRDIEEGRA